MLSAPIAGEATGRCPPPSVRAPARTAGARLKLRASAVSLRTNLAAAPLSVSPLAARRGYAHSHARSTVQPPLRASSTDGPSVVAEFERRINEAVVGSSVQILDSVYADPALSVSYARFYTLETIARVPYFAFLSVLHLYETLGWWRRSDCALPGLLAVSPHPASAHRSCASPRASLLAHSPPSQT